MEKFTTLAELTAYLADKDYPDLFKTELTAAMQTVEACNSNGAYPCYLVIAENDNAAALAEAEFSLSQFPPEYEQFISANGYTWQKRVYVFCDSGQGVVYYRRSQ